MKKQLLLFLIIFFIFQNLFPQWVQTGGPNGGNANEIVMSGSVLILNAGNGGIYRSIDNGSSWKWSSLGLPCNQGIQALVEDNNVLYASISRSGIYTSTDAGLSWTPINSGIENLTFHCLYVNGSNMYAGYSERGAYYSANNGASWVNVSSSVTDMTFTGFLEFNSSLYAGGRSSSLSGSRSLFKTTNNGNTWQPVIVPGIGSNGVQSMTVKGNLFFVANDDTVFISNDGSSWRSTNVDTNASIVSMGVVGNTVFLTTSDGRYYYSEDDGLIWTLVQNPQVNGFANNVLFLNNKTVMTTSQGVYESLDNGVSWSLNNKGLSGIQIEAINYNSQYIYAGTDNQGVSRTSDGGQNWEIINTGLDALNAYTVTDIIVNGNDLFLATGGGVYKSTNNANNWEQKFYPGVNKSAQALDFDGNVLATVVNGSGVYISKDLGENWISTSTTGLNTDTGYDNITIKGNTIIVNTADSEMFISHDLGNSWEEKFITSNFHLTNELEYINDKLYAATTKGLFISENLGENWKLLHNNPLQVYDVILDEGKIYIATSTGAYVTSENDTKWYPLCDGLGKQFSKEILIKDEVIYLGTYNSSVWHRFKVAGELPLKEDQFTIGNEEIILCPNSVSINLFDRIGVPSSTKGEWSPSLSGGNGVFNPAIDVEGIYTFRYSSSICDCENYSKVQVSLDGFNAGTDATAVICLDSDPIDLFEFLGKNADLGGVWTPSLSSGTGFFDPKIDSQGNFTYTVSNIDCPDDSSNVQVSLIKNFDAGLDGELTICSNEPSIDLFSVLKGLPDSGGTWSPELISKSGILDPSEDKPGVYVYTLGTIAIGCLEKSSKVIVNINKIPNAGSDASLSICVNNEGIDLFDNLNGAPDAGGTWSPELSSKTNVFNPLIDLEGIYTYSVNNNCGSDISTIDVKLFKVFEIPNYSIQINESSNKNSLIVTVDSEKLYEYSLDGINFQTNNTFDDLSGGSYNVLGKEINGCGFFEESVFILSYPRFFTPNNDGVNDIWKIKSPPILKYKVYLYDRYGKFLKEFSSIDEGWNGKFNGYPLPATDYWFKAVFEDGKTKLGHFSLKR